MVKMETVGSLGTDEIDGLRYELDVALDTDYLNIFSELVPEDLAAWKQARRFAEEQVLPIIDSYWDRGDYPLQLVAELGKADLLRDGVSVPNRSPISRVAAGLVGMELSRGDASVATVVAVQGGLTMRAIELCGSSEQKARYLPALAAGELLGSFALTEPEHGSDSVALTTRATKVDGGWVLNGVKKWIGNGASGGITVVWARSETDGAVKGFIVPQKTPGYEAEVIQGKTALRAIHQANIRLRHVFVPDDALLPHASSFRDTARVLFSTRVGVAWLALGQAAACFEVALQYARQRVQFGRPLAASQIVQERLARMLSELTQAQLLVLRVARLEDQGNLDGPQASLAKFTATRCGRSIAQNARDLLGGNGILLENRVARHFADIEALHTYEGTETVQALIIGRDLTGISAFS